MACAGDVNGDGFSDVIVGAPEYDVVFQSEGQVRVYLGSPAGLSAAPAWTARGGRSGCDFGYSAAAAGDVDLDGYSDLIIGAPLYNTGISQAGQVRVYRGSSTGPGAQPSWLAESTQPNSGYGWSVGSAGDVNGDGFSDVLVGAIWIDNPEIEEGQVRLHYGGRRNGLGHVPRQRRADDSAPIALLGRTDSPSAFLVDALGRSAAGRADVALQVEVKPAGVPFDGTGLRAGPELDGGLLGTRLELPVTGLSEDARYHWRMRIVSRSPFFPRSPWFSPQGNGRAEMDLRTASGTVAVEPSERSGSALALAPPAPNPFRSTTRLTFVLPVAGSVRLSIYDIAGRRIAEPLSGRRAAGLHTAVWDGTDVSGSEAGPGVYVAKLETESGIAMRRVVRMR